MFIVKAYHLTSFVIYAHSAVVRLDSLVTQNLKGNVCTFFRRLHAIRMCNTISRPLSICWLLQVFSPGRLDARAPPTQLSYLIKIPSCPIHSGKAKLVTGIRGLTIDRALRCIAYGILTLDKASAKSCSFGIISIAISSGFQTNFLKLEV